MAYYFSPFRKEYVQATTSAASSCAFCDTATVTQQAIKAMDGAAVENDHYIWLVNYFPKFEGHTLLVSKRHISSLTDETSDEILARAQLAAYASKVLRTLYPKSGIEYFIQLGTGSAATLDHMHWHLVPALPDDPLRSFEKLGHFYTTKKNEEKIILFPKTIQKAKKELQEALSKIIEKIPFH